MAMAAEASRSVPSPDSYIGSLISLTSKSEIRYEGILYKISTEESSIELRNVRSFGTEGRKKDGLQIPAGDKIYEYILFRGSDIKDLQVKASAPVQTAPTYHDPAIIQSNFPHPPATPLSLPSLGTVSTTEISSHTAQPGIQRPTFQGNPTPYPTSGNLGPWGSTQPSLTSNCSGLSVPMYWQGCYAPSGGLPLMRPLTGIAMPPMQQTAQFEDLNASSSSFPLFPQLSSSLISIPASLPSTVASTQAMPFTHETLQVSVPNKVSTSLSEVATSGSLPPAPHVTSGMEKNIPCVVSSKNRIGPFASMALHIETQSTSVLDTSSSKQAELPITLVTPSQLMQPTQAYVLPLGNTSEEVKIERSENTSKPLLPEPPNLEPESKIKPYAIVKEPIPLLPRQAYYKPTGAVSAVLESHGGLGRGTGTGNEYSKPQAKFTEDFDFSAMNEKFNKDQVWGHLGKSRSYSSGRNEEEEADGFEEGISPSPSSDIKPVYVKDDFFDTISCSSNTSRIRFSEQLKIDTETFGNFPRLRPPYVGGRGYRGGGRGRGLYHGRGYGYPARGRG